MKTRKKRSIIWKISKEELSNLVKESSSIGCILSHFGFIESGGNYLTLKKRLEEESIDYSHIPQGRGHNKGNRRGGVRNIPLKDILVENSSFSRGQLKKRLLKEGLLKNMCYKCFQGPIWNGLPLVLQLEHKNGSGKDNRIENLEILCPNCHTQTDTFAGRNNGS